MKDALDSIILKAAFTDLWVWWPSISIKKTYSHIPILEGLDSSLVMLTLFFAKGATNSAIAPGLFFVATTIEVLSLLDGLTSCEDRTKNLVELFCSSSIFSNNVVKLNKSAARLLAIAAVFFSF